MTKSTDPHFEPYIVVPDNRSPSSSGAFVVCRVHYVTGPIKPDEAGALATALNEEHKNRMAQ